MHNISIEHSSEFELLTLFLAAALDHQLVANDRLGLPYSVRARNGLHLFRSQSASSARAESPQTSAICKCV